MSLGVYVTTRIDVRQKETVVKDLMKARSIKAMMLTWTFMSKNASSQNTGAAVITVRVGCQL